MSRSSLAAALAAVLLASPAMAAPGSWVDAVRPVPAPSDVKAMPLPIALPSPAMAVPPHEGWAVGSGQRMVYNITRPSLIELPATARAGAAQPAVILVPGGGFEFLSIDNEGYQVAERLARLGVRVFILKYRTLVLPDSFEGFHEAIGSTFAGRPHVGGPIDIQADIPYAVSDAQAALRAVRSNARQWNVDPARIGLLGFSAGAITTLVATQANAPDARPDFVGLIYGPTKAGPVPPKAPPLFAALAADDRFFGKDDLCLIQAWRASGAAVEFHLYSGGGHGFASQHTGTTSDGWFDEFARWLRAEKIVTAP